MHKINEKIATLWEKHFGNSDEVYVPLFYSDFTKDSILFVGLNPSFSKQGFKRLLKGTEYESIDPDKFFKWKNVLSDPAYVEKYVGIDKISYDRYSSYFKILRIIAEKAGAPWEHIDLFLYRHTSQKQFLPLIMTGNKLNEFGKDQIKLFTEVVNVAQPIVIVVINAFGSELVREYFEDDITFDDRFGYHHLVLADGRKVPIFFSSMLTGQRALDRWSQERLVWHIRQAVQRN